MRCKRKPKIEKPSDLSHIEYVVSVTFCIKVPKVERGRRDTPVLLAVLCNLGTRSGTLKQHLCGCSMYKDELVAGDKIPHVEFSAHSIVTAQSTGTGQGFQKCSCLSNCVSNKCLCEQKRKYIFV